MVYFASRGLLFLGAAAVVLSFFGSGVVSVTLNLRHIRILRSNYHALWLDLGAPDFWHALLFGGKPFGGIPARSAGAVPGGKYFTWLAFVGYKQIDDPVATETGERLRKLFSRSMILLAAGAASLLGGYFLSQ